MIFKLNWGWVRQHIWPVWLCIGIWSVPIKRIIHYANFRHPVQSSFPIMHKIGNVVIFALLTLWRTKWFQYVSVKLNKVRNYIVVHRSYQKLWDSSILNPGLKPHQCLQMYSLLDWNFLATVLAVKKSAGVAPEVNLWNPLHASNKACKWEVVTRSPKQEYQ